MAQHPYRGLAVVFSFLLPGLGQIYNQEVGKGVGFILAYIISWALSYIVVGWFFLIVVWVWSMVDAYQFAGRVNPAPRSARSASHNRDR